MRCARSGSTAEAIAGDECWRVRIHRQLRGLLSQHGLSTDHTSNVYRLQVSGRQLSGVGLTPGTTSIPPRILYDSPLLSLHWCVQQNLLVAVSLRLICAHGMLYYTTPIWIQVYNSSPRHGHALVLLVPVHYWHWQIVCGHRHIWTLKSQPHVGTSYDGKCTLYHDA